MRYEQCPSIEIEDGIDATYRAINENLADHFAFILAFDRREAYRVDGALTMVDWLCFKYGHDQALAREYVRAAHALDFLPAIADIFREGCIPWNKLRLLVQFATPDEDVSLAHAAIGLSVSELRAMAMRRTRKARELADEAFKRRYVRTARDRDGQTMRIWGRLGIAEGLLVEKTLDRMATQASPDPVTGMYAQLGERCADALVELCSKQAGLDPDPDRANVLVDISLADIIDPHGVGMVEGVPVSAETVRRLACDGRLQGVIHDAAGNLIAAGNMNRTISPKDYRVLKARDVKCRWYGCQNDKWLDAHHEIAFPHGPTDPDNLSLLCHKHHQMVHEGGWSIGRDTDGALVIKRPDGSILESIVIRGTRIRVKELAEAGARGP